MVVLKDYAVHRLASLRSAGFSLLEVLVAVLVLAIGLLALAALLGTVARHSADAKARSRVAMLLSSEMATLRARDYGGLASGVATDDAEAAHCAEPASTTQQAACDAGIASLSTTRTVARHGSTANDERFEAGAPRGRSGAEFKDVVATARWTGASGRLHAMTLRTALGPVALDPNSLRLDVVRHAPQRAVVRQAAVEVLAPDGVSIALGNGRVSTTSHPVAERVGEAIVGTRFDVSVLTPEGASAVVDQRIETTVVPCTCRYGAGGDRLAPAWRQARWPAIWTGARYDLHVPDVETPAPGTRHASGPEPGVVQHALCTECCRDRHDDPDDTVNAKFDPEDAHTPYSKFDRVEGALVAASDTTSARYIEACRLIRVDGLWRTAADLSLRQFGLLETESVDGVQAKTGLPTASAAARYAQFVEDYLARHDASTGTPPEGAQAMFDDPARSLNTPEKVSIAAPSDADPRYLHARGLYVDHLERRARDALAHALAEARTRGRCTSDAPDLADCVLPFLPFATLNLTELAEWRATDPAILAVGAGNTRATPARPSGGRTHALDIGAADSVATVRRSNSGVANAAEPGATDIADDAVLSDAQAFDVGNAASMP